jgi:PAS domain S-box-containing protein
MTEHGQGRATERLRHGFFATLLGVTGVVLSVLGFLAVRNPVAARLVASSDGVASLLTGLAFTAIACALVLHYGRRSAQLSAAYRDLHRATLQRERSEAALRESERFTRATLDAIDAQIAVLDADGVVMAVNRAWRARLHPLLGDTGACDVGSNYLFFCDGVRGERAREVARVAEAVRAITAGEREECLIESVVPDDGSVLVTRVTRFASRGPMRLVVAHQDLSALARAGIEATTTGRAVDPPDPTPAPAVDHFAAIADAAPLGVFRADACGQVTYANGRFLGLGDLDAVAALGDGWLAMVHEDDVDGVIAQWQRIVDGGAGGEAAFRTVDAGGAVRACRLRATPTENGLVAVVLDASAAARADAALARERDVYRHAIGLERSLVFATDAGGRIALANAAAAAFCGTTPPDLVGRVAEHLTPAAASDGDVERFRDHAGTIRSFEVARRTVAAPDGRGELTLAVAVDVTERHAADGAIRALEIELARRVDALTEERDRLLATTRAPLCIAGPTHFAVVNPAFAALLDRTADELTARPLLHFVHPDDRAETARALDRAATGEPVTFENRQRHHDGGWRRVAWTATAAAPDRIYASAQDLTAVDAAAADHRRAAGEITALQAALDLRASEVEDAGRRLAALERELASFSRVVSYDLRAPLRRIDELTRALRDEHGGGLDAAGRRALGVVGEHASRLVQLLDGVLALSGPERRPADPAEVDMTGLVRDAVEAARRADPDRDVLVSIGDLAPAAGDPALLRELLATLIGNAFAATRACDHPCIDVGSVDADGTPVYYVRDNGTGFDGRQAERLFPAVERLPLPAAPDGAGLGLGVVQQIVERHGGRVWAEGRAGDGATFFFTLPRTAPRVSAAAAAIAD